MTRTFLGLTDRASLTLKVTVLRAPTRYARVASTRRPYVAVKRTWPALPPVATLATTRRLVRVTRNADSGLLPAKSSELPAGFFGGAATTAMAAADVIDGSSLLVARTVTPPGVAGAVKRPVGDTVPPVVLQVTPDGALTTAALSWTLVPAITEAGAPLIATEGVAPATVTVAGAGLAG